MIIGQLSELDWLRQDGMEIPYTHLPMTIQGIYVIFNNCTNHFYIGSTVRCFNKRYSQHLYHLKRGTHSNSYLLRSWQKYPANSFRFIPFFQVTDLSKIQVIEQQWLDYFLYFDHPVYNGALDIENFWQECLPKKKNLCIPEIIRPEWHKWVYGGQKRPS